MDKMNYNEQLAYKKFLSNLKIDLQMLREATERGDLDGRGSIYMMARGFISGSAQAMIYMGSYYKWFFRQATKMVDRAYYGK